MSCSVSDAVPQRAAGLRSRGMTLLEVLIACGILVLGLASIAALLPAAGSRLAQAALEDRAGTLAANAYTDAISRGLVSIDLFNDKSKSVGFGKTVSKVSTPGIADQYFAPASVVLGQRIAPDRGFVLEDELLFANPTSAETPVNDFPGGRRAFKEGLCWGATLVPHSFPAVAGMPVTLAIAVFRREADVRQIPLKGQGGGVYEMVTPNDEIMNKFLRSCSYVLAVPQDPEAGPRWVQITASWRAAGKIFVTFADPEFDSFAGAQPRVLGFDAIVRVDEHNLVLE